jgi:hypothetical protein
MAEKVGLERHYLATEDQGSQSRVGVGVGQVSCVQLKVSIETWFWFQIQLTWILPPVLSWWCTRACQTCERVRSHESFVVLLKIVSLAIQSIA